MEKSETDMFLDAESYSGKEEFSFKELVMRHLAKISQICSCEFREGYWQKRPVSMGSGIYMSEVYVEDKRDAYINAVDFIHDILLPHFDKVMLKDDELLEADLNKSKNDYATQKKEYSSWIDEKLVHKRKLFQKLSLLLKRLNYLEQKTRIE